MISRMARGEAVEGGAEAQRGWDTVTYMKLNCLGGNDTRNFGGLVLGCIDADFCK